jgi:hypothetical protein
MIRAMDELLAEINASKNRDIERHPSWSPIILDASSANIGYKLHQRRANPDRIMSVVVDPHDFETDGRIAASARIRITAAVEEFWNGKCSDQHKYFDASHQIYP